MSINDYIVKSGRSLNEAGETVNETNLMQSQLGQLGGKYIATTDATTPDTGYVFVAIKVIEDSVITLEGNITGITSVTLLAGEVVYGRYTSCELTSGKVIAYNGV